MLWLPAHADVRLHALHPHPLDLADELHLLFGGGLVQRAQDGLVIRRDQRQPAGVGDDADQLDREVGRDVERLDRAPSRRASPAWNA